MRSTPIMKSLSILLALAAVPGTLPFGPVWETVSATGAATRVGGDDCDGRAAPILISRGDAGEFHWIGRRAPQPMGLCGAMAWQAAWEPTDAAAAEPAGAAGTRGASRLAAGPALSADVMTPPVPRGIQRAAASSRLSRFP